MTDPTIGIIVVEHRDRLTRFGFNYIVELLKLQNRRIEVIFENDTENELVETIVAVITSMAARIYGRRNSKLRASQVKECVEQIMTTKAETQE